jgi:hypothetical protein
MGLTRDHDLKAFVVIVPANLAFGHAHLLLC